MYIMCIYIYILYLVIRLLQRLAHEVLGDLLAAVKHLDTLVSVCLDVDALRLDTLLCLSLSLSLFVSHLDVDTLEPEQVRARVPETGLST